MIADRFTLNRSLQNLLGADGPLANELESFSPRPEQMAMAEDVAMAIRRGENLVVEAGTGTGKTLAYLVPLLEAGESAVVSTGTKTLQDQLFHRDLPLLSRALGRPATVRLLKGRANYLCLQRLASAAGHAADFPGAAGDLNRARDWAIGTASGDVAELAGIAEDSPIWSRITSTADNCLGADCPRFDDCFVVKARQAAKEADVVVVNHHLLMADLTIKEEGFGRLLPGIQVAIVDEAHHFPDVAQGFFNIRISHRQFIGLLEDIRDELDQAGLGDKVIFEAVAALGSVIAELNRSLPISSNSLAWSEVPDGFPAQLAELAVQFEGLATLLSPDAEDWVGIRRCRERASAVSAAIERILSANEDDGLRWLQRGTKSFAVNMTPLDTATQLSSLLQSQDCAWIFTSATLAVGEDFGHFTQRLGLPALATRQFPSPFDYGRISRLYLPANMPDPAAYDFTARVIDAAYPLIEATGGRAFLLFTSHRALQRAAQLLEEDPDFEFPLLVQGRAPRTRLLEEFAAAPNAVLLGTATFWEGVDIRGHGLVLVIIDRLPFASPGDPLLAARLAAVRKAGGNPFRDHQLPQAVLALKQGVGRLIRDYDDFGVVMIADPRILSKSYGKVFLASLPPMPQLREPDQLVEFLQQTERSLQATGRQRCTTS